MAVCAHMHSDVVEGMACVANYINEMQRVSETYCSLFNTILSENTAICPVRNHAFMRENDSELYTVGIPSKPDTIGTE